MAQSHQIEKLRLKTDEMIDRTLELLVDCVDEDVVFVPEDREAHDPFASTVEEVEMPRTLGHVIVHMTASAEEAAAGLIPWQRKSEAMLPRILELGEISLG